MEILEAFSSLTMGQTMLLLVALVIAFGFECVNGFHDTANAVATVIYTKSLKPTPAVVWSGLWNFIGIVPATFALNMNAPTEEITQAVEAARDLEVELGKPELATMIDALRDQYVASTRLERMTRSRSVASAAAGTIGLADGFGLPVSTTHVLSSGVAGTMWANKSGIQGGTVREIALAWILTLPAVILLSALIYWVATLFTG
jgi:phosphate/sulfate permease